MKKNVLALSITAALVGIGFAGGAQAIGLNQVVGSPIPAGAAVSLKTAVDGIGHFLYVPYYSAQDANNTMINLVNTDTVNGKAVKVRFRGAANSDDVFDFQVFLSPGDVWTASVSKGADGFAKLYTADASCTKPTKGALLPAAAALGTLNGTPFSKVRIDNKRTGDALANETREGYVEIFNMADIPSGSALYTAIKHVKGVAPCTGSAWTGLDTDALDLTAANLKGLAVPTTGLMANWIILNVADAGAWSGAATAINAVDSAGLATTGALTYFPQTNESFPGATGSRIAQFTADPVLRDNPTIAAVYDVPDFSIPYTVSSSPLVQVDALNKAIATTNVMNEFLTNSAIASTTDWVLSMPTRRYSVAYDYKAGARTYSVLGTDFFTAGNTLVLDRQVCVKGITHVSFDQEETTATDPGSDVIISPQEPGVPTSFIMCGEASVLSFNAGEAAGASGLITSASGTLKATVARSAIDNGYVAGWTTLQTPGPSLIGLPVLGYEAVRAVGGLGGSTFGATLPHRTTRYQQ